jgi:4-hydroxyphenylpyruvate dioxygenase-like putative hemolysin
MKKTGRPPVEGEKRTKLVAFYLTETDFAALKDLAEKGGFKSTSSLLTALNEPVIQERLTLVSSVKALSRVQRFMESNGAKFDASWSDVRDGMLKLFTPPPPALPDELLNISQLKQDLLGLLDELEKQETKPKTP